MMMHRETRKEPQARPSSSVHLIEKLQQEDFAADRAPLEVNLFLFMYSFNDIILVMMHIVQIHMYIIYIYTCVCMHECKYTIAYHKNVIAGEQGADCESRAHHLIINKV